MTTFDRIEPQLPMLMDELAPARVPDYFDDLLRQSAQTRQRPRWRSLEGWLPTGADRTAPIRAVPWRPILVAALLLAAAAVTLVLFAGSQRTVPRPFGNGPNGLVLYSADGDIAAIDPDTGESRVVVGGPEHDWGPIVSPDGRSMVFSRTTNTREALWVSGVDGSNARELLATGAADDWIDWSSSGDRVVVTPHDTRVPKVIDVASGAATELQFPAGISSTTWRPGHDQLVVSVVAPASTVTFSLVNSDGTGQRLIATAPSVVSGPSMSADGSLLLYSTWSTEPSVPGQLHLVPVEGGADTLVAPAKSDGLVWQNPKLSPDGSHVAGLRVPEPGPHQLQVGVITVRDTSRTVMLGEIHEDGEGGAQFAFSPDGTRVIVTYADDGSTWIFPVDGGPGRELPVSATQFSWGRGRQ